MANLSFGWNLLILVFWTLIKRMLCLPKYIYIYDIRHFKICMAHSRVQFSTTRETKMVQKKHYVCWASATCHHMVFTDGISLLSCILKYAYPGGFQKETKSSFILVVQGLSVLHADLRKKQGRKTNKQTKNYCFKGLRSYPWGRAQK